MVQEKGSRREVPAPDQQTSSSLLMYSFGERSHIPFLDLSEWYIDHYSQMGCAAKVCGCF